MKIYKGTIAVLSIAVLFLLLSNGANAQAPVYRPNDIVKISVSFEGPDAGKINGGRMYWEAPKNPDPKQSTFSTNITSTISSRKDGNVLEISFVIPQSQASGEYKLGEIDLYISFANGSIPFIYSAGEFPAKTIRIENTLGVTKPKIKDVTVP